MNWRRIPENRCRENASGLSFFRIAAASGEWWLKRLEKLKPQVVMFKGSQDSFSEENGHPVLREAVLRWLRDRRGFLFQGEKSLTFFSPGLEFIDPQKIGGAAHTLHMHNVEYGYGSNVTVAKFEGT